MYKSELEDKWTDDKCVYDFFTGKETKYYHQLLISDFDRSKKLVEDYELKLASKNVKGGQFGIGHYREIKSIKSKIDKHTKKRDSAQFRINKIEDEIKNWFKPDIEAVNNERS